tara:strand:+ start:1022 stop:4144 length:3123 start_codon:yes stop_codon:yes gene_type:complete
MNKTVLFAIIMISLFSTVILYKAYKRFWGIKEKFIIKPLLRRLLRQGGQVLQQVALETYTDKIQLAVNSASFQTKLMYKISAGNAATITSAIDDKIDYILVDDIIDITDGSVDLRFYIGSEVSTLLNNLSDVKYVNIVNNTNAPTTRDVVFNKDDRDKIQILAFDNDERYDVCLKKDGKLYTNDSFNLEIDINFPNYNESIFQIDYAGRYNLDTNIPIWILSNYHQIYKINLKEWHDNGDLPVEVQSSSRTDSFSPNLSNSLESIVKIVGSVHNDTIWSITNLGGCHKNGSERKIELDVGEAIVNLFRGNHPDFVLLHKKTADSNVFILGEQQLTLHPEPKVSPLGNSMFALSSEGEPIYYIGNPSADMDITQAISRLCLYLPDTADTTSAVFAATTSTFHVPDPGSTGVLTMKEMVQVFNNIGIIMLDQNANCYFSAQNLLCVNPICSSSNEYLSNMVSGYDEETMAYNEAARTHNLNNVDDDTVEELSLRTVSQSTCPLCTECGVHKIVDPDDQSQCVWCPHWQKRSLGEPTCSDLECGFSWTDSTDGTSLLLQPNDAQFNSSNTTIVKTINNKPSLSDTDGYVTWSPEPQSDLCEGYIVNTGGDHHYPFSNMDPINSYKREYADVSRVYDGASILVKQPDNTVGITFWNNNIPKTDDFNTEVGDLISNEAYLDLNTNCPGDMDRGESSISYNGTTLGICSRNCAAGKQPKNGNDTQCEDCPAGTYKPEEGNNHCLVCPIGQFQTSTGQTSCDLCINRCTSGRQYTNDTCFEQTGRTSDNQCSTCPPGVEFRTIGGGRYCFNQNVKFTDHGDADGAVFEIGDVDGNGYVTALGSYDARMRVIGGQGYTWKLDKVHNIHKIAADEFMIKKSHTNECWVRVDRDTHHQGRVYNQEDCVDAPGRYFWATTYDGHNPTKNKNSFASDKDQGKPFYYILNSDASGEYAHNQGRSCVKNVKGTPEENSFLTVVKRDGPAAISNTNDCKVFQNFPNDKQCDFKHNHCTGTQITVYTPGTPSLGGTTPSVRTTTCSTTPVSGVVCQ